MNKGELVDEISKKAKVTKKQADAVLSAALEAIMEAVQAVVVEPEEAIEEDVSAPEPICDQQMDKVMTLASTIAEQAKATGVIGIFACFIPPES